MSFSLITAALNLPVLSVLLSVSWILITRAGNGGPRLFPNFPDRWISSHGNISIIRFTLGL